MPGCINTHVQIYFFRRKRFVRAFAFGSQTRSDSVRSAFACVCVVCKNTSHTEYALHRSRTFGKIFIFYIILIFHMIARFPADNKFLILEKSQLTQTHMTTLLTQSHTAARFEHIISLWVAAIFHDLHKNLTSALPWLLRAF